MLARILTVLLGGALAFAQAPASFEVATIKPADPAAVGLRIGLAGQGRITFSNATLVDLVRFAFGEGLGTNLQIIGGPSWASRDHYNLEAQAEGTPGPDQYRVMLRALLADRFAMKFHRETKEVDVYALVVAKEGKLGPKVKAWDGNCNGRPQTVAQPNSKVPACSALFRPPGLTMEGVTMSAVADMLSTPVVALGRPVVDRTGMSGQFNMELEFAFAPPNVNDAPAPAAADPLAPSIFTAVQEQLGLKLESAKGQGEVFVIEQAEHPSEN